MAYRQSARDVAYCLLGIADQQLRLRRHRQFICSGIGILVSRILSDSRFENLDPF